MRGEKAQVRKGRGKKKADTTRKKSPSGEREGRSQAGGRVRCVQWRTAKARAGEGRKSRQAEWSGWSFLVGDGMYGMDCMDGWMAGWMDEWMDGWMGWDISCNAGTALRSRLSPPSE